MTKITPLISKQEFEKKYVSEPYERIAQHFKVTRIYSWPKVEEYIQSLDKGTTIYDIGCGNGRNLNLRDDCSFIGCDNCLELLNEALKKNPNCVYGDNLLLPFENNCAQAVLSIAVIHHFSTNERRLQALRELFRILKPGGTILIYVWSHEQERFKNTSQDALVNWNEQTTGVIYQRYYYLFKKNELDLLISNNFQNINIKESGEQCHNYYIIAQKIH